MKSESEKSIAFNFELANATGLYGLGSHYGNLNLLEDE